MCTCANAMKCIRIRNKFLLSLPLAHHVYVCLCLHYIVPIMGLLFYPYTYPIRIYTLHAPQLYSYSQYRLSVKSSDIGESSKYKLFAYIIC